LDDIAAWAKAFGSRIDEIEEILSGSRIFKQRLINIGVVAAEQAVDWGFTGVILRGSGVDWDIRKVRPYEVYDKIEFDIPVGQNGDRFDRYLIRVAEMRESLAIVWQCLINMPEGPVKIADNKIVPPDRATMKNRMEGLIHHFKLFTEGVRIPVGSVYAAIEAPKGEMGV